MVTADALSMEFLAPVLLKGLEAPPPLAVDVLRMLLRSLDSTLSELPVESLVMVTDPDDEAAMAGDEAGRATEAVTGVEEDADSCESLVVVEEDLTGEIVTLPVSFLLGELEPNNRPSSSSTLSNADEADFC